MSWLKKIERRLDPLAISNITLFLVAGQTFVYLSGMLGLIDLSRLTLEPILALHGEPWRLLTFIFIPPSTSWLFIAFALYFLYFMGSALETYWGALRYNLFLLVGYLLTVGFAFITPDFSATNIFIGGSIFLAFAYLNPEFVLYIFFILPVRIKWIGLITWVVYGYQFVTGDWSTRNAIIAAVGNFLLFFSRDIVLQIRTGHRRMSHQSKMFAAQRGEDEPRHRCHVCGKTDLTNPEMDFRYCSKCAGDQCYCPEHIRNHEHVVATPEETK